MKRRSFSVVTSLMILMGPLLYARGGPEVALRRIEEERLYPISELMGGSSTAGGRCFLRAGAGVGEKREGLYFIFHPGSAVLEALPEFVVLEAQAEGELALRRYSIPWPAGAQGLRALRQEISLGIVDWPNKALPLYWRIALVKTAPPGPQEPFLEKILWTRQSVGASIGLFQKN